MAKMNMVESRSQQASTNYQTNELHNHANPLLRNPEHSPNLNRDWFGPFGRTPRSYSAESICTVLTCASDEYDVLFCKRGRPD